MFSVTFLLVGILIIAFHHHDDDCSIGAAAPKMYAVNHNYFPFDLKELLFGSMNRSELDNRAPPCLIPVSDGHMSNRREYRVKRSEISKHLTFF